MSNRYDQIRKAAKQYLKNDKSTCVLDLSDAIEQHVTSVLNQWNSVRGWFKKSDIGVEIKQKSRAIGSPIISKKGEIAETPFDAEINEIPYIQFGIKHSITHDQLTSGDENATVDVLERFISSIATGMQIAEMTEFCNYIVKKSLNEQKVVNVGEIQSDRINIAFNRIERYNWIGANMIIGSNTYSRIRTFGKNFLDEASTREILTTGLFGHLWTADIRVIPDNSFSKAIILGTKEALPIEAEKTIQRYAVQWIAPRQSPIASHSIIPHEDHARTRHVFEIKSEIGISINDLTGISVIDLVCEKSD